MIICEHKSGKGYLASASEGLCCMQYQDIRVCGSNLHDGGV